MSTTNPEESAGYPPVDSSAADVGQPVANPNPYAAPAAGNQNSAYGRQPPNYAQPQGQWQQPPNYAQPGFMVPVVPKSKVAAALLAFCFGTLGVHNFYLGHSGRGAAQLILTILGWFTLIFAIGIFMLVGVGIWVFVEFILILVGAGGYDKDARGVPLIS